MNRTALRAALTSRYTVAAFGFSLLAVVPGVAAGAYWLATAVNILVFGFLISGVARLEYERVVGSHRRAADRAAEMARLEAQIAAWNEAHQRRAS